MPPSSDSNDSNPVPPHEYTEPSAEDVFFQQFVHDALDGFRTLDDRATIRFANEAASDIFGYDVDELVGRSVDELFPERYRNEYLAELQRRMHDTESAIERTDLERVGRRSDGSEVPLSFSLCEHTYRD